MIRPYGRLEQRQALGIQTAPAFTTATFTAAAAPAADAASSRRRCRKGRRSSGRIGTGAIPGTGDEPNSSHGVPRT